MLDITAEQLNLLQGLLQQHLPHTTAMAFGSRVGNWPFGRGPKPYSDLNIALVGLTAADALALANLRADLEESTLPWRVDISDTSDLPPALCALVLEHGVLLHGQPPQACQA